MQPTAVQKRATKKNSAAKGSRKGDDAEDEEEVDPKKQTMQALVKVLSSTTSESQLRDNASNILQLFSDLPPYSLFHEDENKTLDAFEELLTSFLSGGQARSAKQPSAVATPSLYSQVEYNRYINYVVFTTTTTTKNNIPSLTILSGFRRRHYC